MCLVDQLPCGSVLTTAISWTKFKIHSAYGNSPMAKSSFLISPFREDQSLLHRSRNSGIQCAWWSSYVIYLLYKIQDPCSACRQSHGQNMFSSHSSFLGRTSLCFTAKRNSGRKCAWWTNSFVGQFLHQLSLVQSSRSILIQHMPTVLRSSNDCNFCFTN